MTDKQELPGVGAPAGAGAAPAHKKTLARRIGVFVVGFFISLAVGWLVEHATSRETLDWLYEAQAGWLDAVNKLAPLGVWDHYWRDLSSAWSGEMYHGENGLGVLSPVIALGTTVYDYIQHDGLWSLIQLGVGALGVALLAFLMREGRSVLPFDELLPNLIVCPILAIALASGSAWLLQGIMWAGLQAFHWITGLAAMAAGATGIGGFCWFCVTKLGEKGVEHSVSLKH